MTMSADMNAKKPEFKLQIYGQLPPSRRNAMKRIDEIISRMDLEIMDPDHYIDEILKLREEIIGENHCMIVNDKGDQEIFSEAIAKICEKAGDLYVRIR